jgi:hypothetical protein
MHPEASHVIQGFIHHPEKEKKRGKKKKAHPLERGCESLLAALP